MQVLDSIKETKRNPVPNIHSSFQSECAESRKHQTNKIPEKNLTTDRRLKIKPTACLRLVKVNGSK